MPQLPQTERGTNGRSKPIKQAGEINTRFAAVSVSYKRLPLVRVSFERSCPIQKMNFGSERIWHSQVHLPSVSAKYHICQCAEIAGQHAVDRLKVGPPP